MHFLVNQSSSPSSSQPYALKIRCICITQFLELFFYFYEEIVFTSQFRSRISLQSKQVTDKKVGDKIRQEPKDLNDIFLIINHQLYNIKGSGLSDGWWDSRLIRSSGVLVNCQLLFCSFSWRECCQDISSCVNFG